ncbi:chemotaxis protein CheD [Acetobacterium woodii]|uniref:Probable chemoreceptor glutamine deamidase CheD n=1 Tax=Acetobacterium woodii (strain ATCC 29683 / DSM 1030 / JCM 2381 / KCTC 1655 / WB1) TaxID=931626 RepID=H6LE24_ACEWD|nr:chemotaxis protein CheD [Acetobacterium woodii]AFA49257.1 chemotaxis protein deaminase CheD2 [Acetobacterium woodii DSM 1030]
MSQSIVIGISDYRFAKAPEVLVTYALGSCVGVCLYDKVTKVGGLSHIMLPDSTNFSNKDINRKKFADTAIVDLVQDMKKLGVGNNRLVAKIAGGAQMFEVQAGSKLGAIGERNIICVKQVLSQLRIPIIAEDTGLNFGRTQYFDLATGIMKIQSLNRRIEEF